jgi:hypothetical protein
MARSDNKRNSLAFSGAPPTECQIEKWHPVVRSRKKVQILGFGPSYGALWFHTETRYKKVSPTRFERFMKKARSLEGASL